MIKTLQNPPPRSSEFLTEDMVSQVWSGWFRRITETFNNNLAAGYTGTITTAKLTGGGTNGSITFVNGVVTAQVAAT